MKDKNNKSKFIKKLDDSYRLDVEDREQRLHWLSFFELGDKEDLFYFIKNCKCTNKIDYSLNKIDKVIIEKEYMGYLLYEADNPIGFIIGHITDEGHNSKEADGVLVIEELGILPDRVSQGYEKVIIRGIFEKSWNRKIEYVKILLDTADKKFLKLMSQLGFKEI